MTLRSRSWVIGRGVAMFSICSAIAFASKIPTQIGSTFCPSLSRRITIGVFVIGSTISPLIVISICMAHPAILESLAPTSPFQMFGSAPDAVRAGTLDPHGHRPPDPRRRARQVDDDVLRRTTRELRLTPSACGVDQDVDGRADQ